MSKIAILTTEFHGDPAPGGIGTYAYYLARGLSANGQQVHVVTISQQTGKSALCDNCWIHRVKQTSVLSNYAAAKLPYTNYALSRSYAVWKYLVDELPDASFDCLDVQDHLALGLWNALCDWLPMAVRVQTPIFLLQIKDVSNIPAGFDTLLVEMAESFTLRKADMLIGSNRSVLDEVVRCAGADSVRQVIQRNPIDLSEFPARENYDRASSDLNVVFVGRLELRKGVYTLLEALSLALRDEPSLRLKFIGVDTECGTGPGSVQEQLKARSRELKIEDRLEFLAPMPLSDLPAIYADADVAVVPSLFDNAPYGMVAAMAAGLPVIGSDSGGLPEYIGFDSRGIVVPAGNTQALAGALARVAADRDLRERLGRSARQFVENECDYRVVANQSLDVYGDLAGCAKSRKGDEPTHVTDSLKQLERFITGLDDWTATELVARSRSYDAGYASGMRDGFAHAVRQSLLTRAAHRLSDLMSAERRRTVELSRSYD